MPESSLQALAAFWRIVVSAVSGALGEICSGLSILLHNHHWSLDSAWPVRHGPSQIPTELDLPHKVFGSQVVDDSPFDRPEILPFSIYAACRILDTTPDDEDNGEIYECLRTIAACYVRADMSSICDCITAYKLNEVLSKATRLKKMQHVLVSDCTGRCEGVDSGVRQGTDAGADLEHEVDDDASYKCTVRGKPPAAPIKDTLTLQGTIGALMHELEAILHEYLSFNWDRMEEVNTANAPLQRKEGLACPWRPSKDIEHSAFGSFPDHDYMHRDHDYLHGASSHSGNDSDTSSQASPNSRLRRSTFPADFEGAQSQEIPSSQSSPMSRPSTPVHAPPHRYLSERQLGPSQNGTLERQEGQPQGQPERPPMGHLERQPQAQPEGQRQSAQPEDSSQQPAEQDVAPGSKDDGFNSDPEHSSRMLRLRATHLLGSERQRSPGKGSPPRKGIRRAASEAQIMQKYSARLGNAQQIGSFGSHTSDSTRSFDEYLRTHRSPSPSPKSRAKERAKANWQRAQKAAEKSITMHLLKGKRELVTLAELVKMLGGRGDQSKLDPNRQPICLLLGGGMAAGKSTVRKIIGQAEFWTRVGKDAVVVEADAMKSMDVIYKQLSKMSSFQHEPDVSSYVHEYSTKQAEALFVSAINRQKDVIFDGTMMWAPFVEQTIAMVRDHQRNYRRGPGYKKDDNGNVTEQYWEVDPTNSETCQHHKPYRIEVIGVTCDPGLAVARGVWRKLRTGRSVRTSTLLRSHRLFSEHFERTAHLVDVATLYHTGSALTTFNKGSDNLQPKVIALRSMQYTSGEMLYNPSAYEAFKSKVNLNDQAACRADLYANKPLPENSTVPVSQEGQMSALRQAFRTADEEERERRYEAFLSESLIDADDQ